ncbi:MAG: hypothetical protein U0401_27925 [Anaerolineae bacterium]
MGRAAFEVLRKGWNWRPGGAAVLGREAEIGSLAVGKTYRRQLERTPGIIGKSGGIHDPWRLCYCAGVDRVDLSVINGKTVVRNGQLLTVDLGQLIAATNALAAEFVGRHPRPERFKLV